MRLFLSAYSGLVPLPKLAGLFFGRIILIFQGPADSLLSSCPRWCSPKAVTDQRQPVLSARQMHGIAACLLHPLHTEQDLLSSLGPWLTYGRCQLLSSTASLVCATFTSVLSSRSRVLCTHVLCIHSHFTVVYFLFVLVF